MSRQRQHSGSELSTALSLTLPFLVQLQDYAMGFRYMLHDHAFVAFRSLPHFFLIPLKVWLCCYTNSDLASRCWFVAAGLRNGARVVAATAALLARVGG